MRVGCQNIRLTSCQISTSNVDKRRRYSWFLSNLENNVFSNLMRDDKACVVNDSASTPLNFSPISVSLTESWPYMCLMVAVFINVNGSYIKICSVQRFCL